MKDQSNIIVFQQQSEIDNATPMKQPDENVHEEQGTPKGESKSSEKSEVCMQEIVSPFRDLKLSRGPNDRFARLSPENQKKAFE